MEITYMYVLIQHTNPKQGTAAGAGGKKKKKGKGGQGNGPKSTRRGSQQQHSIPPALQSPVWILGLGLGIWRGCGFFGGSDG